MPPTRTRPNSRPRRPAGRPIIRTDAQIDAEVMPPPDGAEIAELVAYARRISPIVAALLLAKDEVDADTESA